MECAEGTSSGDVCGRRPPKSEMRIGVENESVGVGDSHRKGYAWNFLMRQCIAAAGGGGGRSWGCVTRSAGRVLEWWQAGFGRAAGGGGSGEVSAVGPRAGYV